MPAAATAASSALLKACLPLGEDDDIRFAEPWEAKAFAMVVLLSGAGHFSWGEWVECFSKEVQAATELQAAGKAAPTYYEQWLAAARKMLVAKGLTTHAQLRARSFGIGAGGSMHLLKT
ncbi:MAG: nitrile hydratase accessory protein [Burkholderiales bacterium]|nr:nitrile hydratase accessory protein [Burkholderiales bacterium]